MSPVLRIKASVKPVADEDIKKLESFARKNGFTNSIETYDYLYWSNAHTSQKYK